MCNLEWLGLWFKVIIPGDENEGSIFSIFRSDVSKDGCHKLCSIFCVSYVNC